jgi:hypothetical protein
MQSSQVRTILAGLAIAVIVVAILWAGRRPAEQAPAPPPAEQKTAAQPQAPEPQFVDEYQRSIAIYQFKKAAASGPGTRPRNFLLQMLVLP